jgi:nucleoid-associated protein YgaU
VLPTVSLLPAVTLTPSPRPSASPSPAPFAPTPIYSRGAGASPSPVAAADDRGTLTAARGAVEGNVAGTAARPGLIRKADGKDYYVVQKDDKGYWGIAAKPSIYGDGRKWDIIAKANPNVDAVKLHAGQELVIPPVAKAAGASTTPPAAAGAAGNGSLAVAGGASPAAAASAGGEKYTVKSGDTLEGIASRKYGDGTKWVAIAKANPGLDPAHLKVGQEIVLPAIAETARGTTTTVPAGGEATPRPELARPPASSPSPSSTPAVRPRPTAPAGSGWD